MDFGAIKPVDLSPAENEALCDELAAIHSVLSEYANGVYGEPSVKRLRNDFTLGRHVIRTNPEARVRMERLLELEPKVLSAFVKESVRLVESFWTTHRSTYTHLDEGDYLQEACLAILSAAYSYNGRTKFSTYVYHAIKKRLISCIRREKAPVFSATDSWGGWAQDDEQSFLDVPVVIEDKPDPELMRLAVAEAGLEEIEMIVIQAFMKGVNVTGIDFLESLGINPNTGNPWTRQRVGQIYKDALAKIKFAYLVKSQKVAA